jgi:thymidylate kinase
VKTPHAKPPHAAPVALARLCWYACDYWLGHLLHVRKGRAQSDLVLFDRHAADMACDPRRYRLGLPRWLLRLVLASLPKPQLTFVLLADAETLAQRKGEIPSDRVEQVLEGYRALAANGGSVRGVNAMRPIEEVVADIERQVFEHMKASVRR